MKAKKCVAEYSSSHSLGALDWKIDDVQLSAEHGEGNGRCEGKAVGQKRNEFLEAGAPEHSHARIDVGDLATRKIIGQSDSRSTWPAAE